MNNLILCNISWYSGLSHYALMVAKFLLKKNEKVVWALEANTVLWDELKNIPEIELLSVKSRKPIDFIKNYRKINKTSDVDQERILVINESVSLHFPHGQSSYSAENAVLLEKVVSQVQ